MESMGVVVREDLIGLIRVTPKGMNVVMRQGQWRELIKTVHPQIL